MNLQEALKHEDLIHSFLNVPDGKAVVAAAAVLVMTSAARSVVEGTDIPDYEAAIAKHSELWPVPLSTRGEAWLREVVDAAVKGRRLVEWEDTDE